MKGDSPLAAPTRRFPLAAARLPLALSHGATGIFAGATGPFPKRHSALYTGDSLSTGGKTRGTDWAHAGATRGGDSATREAPRGGEGDDSLRRVARAGADSPLRDAPRHYRVLRHYRVPRHFLRGPFLHVTHMSPAWFGRARGALLTHTTTSVATSLGRTSPSPLTPRQGPVQPVRAWAWAPLRGRGCACRTVRSRACPASGRSTCARTSATR